tara:strand:+ start:3648 stop:3962 length:315 start_codon:yes stop_codon:yes gene_type:complete
MKIYREDIDYCGPEGSVLSNFVPRKIEGIDINRCCYDHDQAYEKGGNFLDRMLADLRFRADLKIRLVSLDKKLRKKIVWVYFLAVLFLGGSCFGKGAKDETCDK